MTVNLGKWVEFLGQKQTKQTRGLDKEIRNPCSDPLGIAG